MLDTRELGRRPGTQRRVARSEPAPADLGIDVLGVPAGSTIDLDLRLEAVMEGVLVTGGARVRVVGECARCLDSLDYDLEVDLQELYAYDDDVDVVEDDETRRLDDDLIDLEPAVRDAVVLSLPFGPLCRDDCPGLCAECGARLADDPNHTHGDRIDPRWADLAALLDERPAADRNDGAGTDEE